MKIKKFLKSIEEFFKTNKKEQNSLEEALFKLEEKRVKLENRLLFGEFGDEKKEHLQEKLKMIKDMKIKIDKKLEKLKIKNSIK
ncbi:hypothetical protein [Arcobacter vandammei]|uniref:hypothetical protein n=1 Tax=Arcobacter vandammei TaxID=2782243 RepID=UPI0018DF3066|nr:hypothetical protein [Arcobacter vandammei]